jgi:hypothetical protein
MIGGATPRAGMLRGVVGLAMTLDRIELEGDAEGDCRIVAESEFPVEVFRVRRNTRRRRVFTAVTEFMSSPFAT